MDTMAGGDYIDSDAGLWVKDCNWVNAFRFYPTLPEIRFPFSLASSYLDASVLVALV
jgi:hypothetical protein